MVKLNKMKIHRAVLKHMVVENGDLYDQFVDIKNSHYEIDLVVKKKDEC